MHILYATGLCLCWCLANSSYKMSQNGYFDNKHFWNWSDDAANIIIICNWIKIIILHFMDDLAKSLIESLPVQNFYRDLAEICRDLTMMFEKPINIMARSQRSRHICWFLKSRRVRGEIFYISRDWRDLAMKFDSFCILPRFWKTQTSYRDCQNITESFPDGADLPLSYSMAINCLKKLLFKFCFVEVGFSFCFFALFLEQRRRRRQTD